MADDVIEMIKTDHRELDRLLEMMRKDKGSRPLALPLAVAMLEAHSRAEEEHVYPVLVEEAGEKEETRHATEEHHEAERLGRRLLEMDWESAEFEQALEKWIDAVRHHVEEEEQDLLTALGEALDAGELHRLGLRFAGQRSEELAGKALHGDGGEAGSSGGGRNGGGPTRDELYAKARELGVEGRSTMNKEELGERVREAEAGV
ncbi:hemerythrin domain-containing protein [Streptomyces somaliensis DSM 40738]|uniref:Hemerythrin HHE cation-binding protein n=1 Tax=Streptomyces somaliensis (strain ATCC 33201 / DSM 40738 / JCM 12659 / KCTC 9044 / NCTC 11332 / NRRL B-12077 / IP 733) TaxID=1134445 RepID=A0AA44IBY9_STRE0|nr:hemerythrin domain-containing protein [Streptomyces somaliensis]MCQ0023684.1 hemerythrin domain-containing protein [Streptomyces somaliensis DSM 40738]NKY13120.1 hemerythrin HHE cation-binding protein [Streptomyces somaliensis DSM 40738]